jgi:hypothetical protein
MTTWAWEQPETSTIDYDTVIFTPEGEATFAEEPVLAQTCSVALLGDSTVACSYLPPANRPENHLLVRLRRAFPDQRFEVQNLAAEEGSGLDPARLAQIFDAIPAMHLAFLRCHIRETEEEGFQTYMRGLQAGCEALRRQYPGVTVILETGIWIHHPAHLFEESQGHLAPLYNSLKAWAIEAGYAMVDIYQKMQAEAGKGNWDLRVRGLPTREQTVLDDSFDAFFGEEPLFFANIHPNSRCLALIAEWEIALLKLLARKP